MKTTRRTGPLLALAILAGLTLTALAAVYTYKCPKCGVMQSYDRSGIYKCPRDGWTMIPSS